VIRTLGEYDELTLDKLGPRVRVDYGGETGREWLRELVTDLSSDGLVDITEDGETTTVRLRQ